MPAKSKSDKAKPRRVTKAMVKQHQANRQIVHVNIAQAAVRRRRGTRAKAPAREAPMSAQARMHHITHFMPVSAPQMYAPQPVPAAHAAAVAHHLQPDHITLAEVVKRSNQPLARMDTAALPGTSAAAEVGKTVYTTTSSESAFTAADRERDASEWLTMKHAADPRLTNPFLPERSITMPISSNGEHVVLPPAQMVAATRDTRPRTNQTDEEILEIIAHGAEPVSAPVFNSRALGIKHAMYNKPPRFNPKTGGVDQQGSIRY